jgi:hypothetical protein
MKYYDSMGQDVSAYVAGLEAKVKQIEKPVAAEVVKDEPAPKTTRKK